MWFVLYRQFDQMCDLMSESDNWELYRNEISRLVASGTAFIPFLGMFLTQVRMDVHTGGEGGRSEGERTHHLDMCPRDSMIIILAILI